jgi:transposase
MIVLRTPSAPGSAGRLDMSDLYWLTDEQMALFSTRARRGIIFVNRNGLRWRDAPREYGPAKTLYNRWKR